MSKTATTLAKLALSVAQQRESRMRARLQQAEAAATANESMVRQLAAERVEDLRDRSSTAPTRAQAEDMVREVFAVEAMVRGVFAELKDELRGKDGQNVKPEAVEATVRAVFAEMAPGLKGKDGKSIKPEAVEAMVRQVFGEHKAELKGEPGKDVDLVQVSAMVRQSLEALGHVKPTAEAMQAAIKAEVQMIAPELRGADGSPGLIWKGEWQRGVTYRKGEVVRHQRATWIAREETVGVAPGSDKRRWELMVRDGEDGGSGGGGFASSAPAPEQVKWTLADTAYPYFGYTAHGHNHWKIEQITEAGTAITARPAANPGLAYAAAWADRTNLTYTP